MMNKDNRNDKIRKIAKKGLTFSLCAVLAGGLAAGSFEGVNKLAGWSGATTVEAASNKDETTLTYAKSEKKDADASDSKSDTGKDTEAKTQKEAFRVIAHAAYEAGFVKDENAYFEGMCEREKEATTGFQDGIAIPHSKHATCIKPGIFLVKFEHPIAWNALDRKSVV